MAAVRLETLMAAVRLETPMAAVRLETLMVAAVRLETLMAAVRLEEVPQPYQPCTWRTGRGWHPGSLGRSVPPSYPIWHFLHVPTCFSSHRGTRQRSHGLKQTITWPYVLLWWALCRCLCGAMPDLWSFSTFQLTPNVFLSLPIRTSLLATCQVSCSELVRILVVVFIADWPAWCWHHQVLCRLQFTFSLVEMQRRTTSHHTSMTSAFLTLQGLSAIEHKFLCSFAVTIKYIIYLKVTLMMWMLIHNFADLLLDMVCIDRNRLCGKCTLHVEPFSLSHARVLSLSFTHTHTHTHMDTIEVIFLCSSSCHAVVCCHQAFQGINSCCSNWCSNWIADLSYCSLHTPLLRGWVQYHTIMSVPT